MSFKEYRPGRGSGIFRSRSFAGFLNHRSMASPTSPLSTPVLGQCSRPLSSGTGRLLSPSLGTGFPRKGTPKLPKVPRPNRTLLIFHSVKKGIAECIKATEDDIESLRVSEDISASSSTGQGRIMELEKQVKAAERYEKKLEFHLSKLEELEDDYKLQLQLREGVRTMAKAYVSSDGLSKRESLTQVKSGFKECTQNLCAIEAQLENMMGTFHCSLKGLVGFARLIPGDVYEVSIRHGAQKWRTKGRVAQTNAQQWDHETHLFKAQLGEVLNIKAMENKSLKSVVLGQKNCETRDLFSANPQMMTVNINANGSIKLSILVNWNPLEGMDETFHPYEPAPRLHTPTSSSAQCKRRVHSMYINQSDSYSDLSSDNSSTGGGSVSHRFSVPTFPSTSFASLAALTTSPPYQSTMSPPYQDITSPMYQSITSSSCCSSPGGGVLGAAGASGSIASLASSSSSSTATAAAGAFKLSSPHLPSYHHSTIIANAAAAAAAANAAAASSSSSPRAPQRAQHIGGATRPNSIAIMGTIAELESMGGNVGGCYAGDKYHHHRPCQRSQSSRVVTTSVHDLTPTASSTASASSSIQPKPFHMRQLKTSLSLQENVMTQYRGSGDHNVPVISLSPVVSLKDALEGLVATLEDYQGRFSELQRLEEAVRGLHRWCKGITHSDSPSKEITQSIETALGAFDFLEAEDYHDGYGSATSSRRSSLDQLESRCTLSPESTAKTADSGIECIATRLSEDGAALEAAMSPRDPLDSPSNGSQEDQTGPEAELTTRNAQVDEVLVWHLAHCDRLFQHIGNFGPMKCREIRSLEKLRQQAAILENLTRLAKQGSTIAEILIVMRDLTACEEIRQFWLSCVEEDNNPLCINAEKFLAHMERQYGDKIRDKYDVSASSVFRHFVAKIVDVPTFNPELYKPCPKISMHQFFNVCNHTDPLSILMDLAHELWIVQRLRSGCTDIVIKTVLTYRDRVPAAPCLRAMVTLLCSEDMEVRNAVTTYIKSIGLAESRRKQSVVILVEALEEKNTEIRSASLTALRLLQASEAQSQLVYLCQSDPSSHIRQKARDVLFSFGEEGRAAFEESQRSSHGFQGVRL